MTSAIADTSSTVSARACCCCPTAILMLLCLPLLDRLLPWLHQHPQQALLQQCMCVDPRVVLVKQRRPVPACCLDENGCTTRVKPQVGCDVVHLAVQHNPGVVSSPVLLHLLQRDVTAAPLTTCTMRMCRAAQQDLAHARLCWKLSIMLQLRFTVHQQPSTHCLPSGQFSVPLKEGASVGLQARTEGNAHSVS